MTVDTFIAALVLLVALSCVCCLFIWGDEDPEQDKDQERRHYDRNDEPPFWGDDFLP